MKNKRDFCISTVRAILQERKIKYDEIHASTDSVYFRLNLENSRPCLRLSDHPHGKRKPSKTLYWIVGENSKNKTLKHRIENMIVHMIKGSRIGTVMGMIERLGDNNE